MKRHILVKSSKITNPTITSIIEQQIASADWFILVTSHHPGQAIIRGRTIADTHKATEVWQVATVSGMKDWPEIEITVKSVNGGEVNGDMTLAQLGKIITEGIQQEHARQSYAALSLTPQERAEGTVNCLSELRRLDAITEALESGKAERVAHAKHGKH